MDSVVDTDSFFFYQLSMSLNEATKASFKTANFFLTQFTSFLALKYHKSRAEIVPGTCFCFVFFGISLVKDPQELGRQ